MFSTRKTIRCLSEYVLSNSKYLNASRSLNKSKIVIDKTFPIFSTGLHNLSDQSNPKRSTYPVNKFVWRTHTCGELTIENVGDTVLLNGWMEFHRMGKFIILRDCYGSTQLYIPPEKQDLIEIVENLPYESVLSVVGKVVQRPKGQENKQMKTGDIEVIVESLDVLNKPSIQIPFNIREHNKPKEQLQMKYRYLALRFPEMQRNLRLRSSVIARMRDFLINEGEFVDVETPTLFKSTPGGAQEFIVPTKHPGKFYSLVQSPQQFKQLLMIGGIDRYFQIARCYRDESGRSDRQPEFTQLDIEMSFTNREGIINLIESLLESCLPQESVQVNVPFKRLTYSEAMELYGSEQPDLRIPHQIVNLTDIVVKNENGEFNDSVYAIVFPNIKNYFTTSVKQRLIDMRNEFFSNVKLLQLKSTKDSRFTQMDKLFSESITDQIVNELNLNEGDVLFIAVGSKFHALSLLGELRVALTNILESSKNIKIRSSTNEFVWIVDFPLFKMDDDDTKKLKSMHHPFTQPHPEDVNYLKTDPIKMRSLHYDLVMNGSEIAGGSIRIHDPKLQEEILKILDIDVSYLQHLLDALASGAPPHGGIALGLDRLICILCNAPSIRSVIAFPKTMEGRDLMSDAPTCITEHEKKLYHLK